MRSTGLEGTMKGEKQRGRKGSKECLDRRIPDMDQNSRTVGLRLKVEISDIDNPTVSFKTEWREAFLTRGARVL